MGESTQQPPVWQRPDLPENRWPVFIAVIAVIFLQRAIPLEYTVQPRWPLILLEGLLLMVLALINPVLQTRAVRLRTAAVLVVLGVIAARLHWPLIAAGAAVLLAITAITPVRLTRFAALGTAVTWVLLGEITLDNTASAATGS